MNGSRSNTPNYGSKSSLDQLSRTIEGLEARIQGLVSERKQPRPPQTQIDPLTEIMERQRMLGGAARERVAAAKDRTPRHEPEIRQPIHRSGPEPRQPAYRQDPEPADERQAESNAMGEIAATLQALRAELKHSVQDTIAPDLDAILSDMRNLKSTAAGTAGGTADLRDELSRLGVSIARLEDGLRVDGAADLRADLNELREMTAGLAREDSIRNLEKRWDRTESRLSTFEPDALKEELVQLAWRIDGIKAGLGEFSAAPAVRSLEDKLIAVASAIETIGRHVNARPDFSGQFAGLDHRLDEISRAIAASASQSSSAIDNAALRRLESRIGELVTHVDSLQQSNPESEIAERIDALAMRIEDLANEDAALKLEERIGQLSSLIERNFHATRAPDISDHLEDISRKIDGLGNTPADALLQRLEKLSQQIDDFEMPVETSSRAAADLTAMARLETRLSDIATRLDESAAAAPADTGALQNLERQIASLSSLLSQPPSAIAASVPDDVSNRMAALEDYIASSDEFIVEAARQAAEAVVEAYSRTGIGAGHSNASDLSALTSLAEDLRALEAHTRVSEERTADTFSALHATLVQIAGRLDTFGSEKPAPVIGREANRTAEVQPLLMPKASQPVFAETAFSPARPAPMEEPVRRPPQNPKVEVLQEQDLLEAAADADSTSDAVDAVAAAAPKETPVAKSLIAGLAARFKPARKEKAALSGRVAVDPTPALDAGDMLVSEDSGLLLEPGSGVPDVKKIMEKVRAGQAAGNAGGKAAPIGQADVIAAARRAAQAAAQEAGLQKLVQPASKGKSPARDAKAPKAAGTSDVRRPILLAAAAVLLVVMSYPLVSNLIGSRQAEIQAEQPPVVSEPVQQDSAADPVIQPDPAIDAESAVPADLATVDAAPAIAPEKVETGAEQLMTPADNTSDAGTLTKSDAALPSAEDAAVPQVDQPVVATDVKQPAAEMAKAPAATALDVPLPNGLQPASLVEAAKKGDPLAYFEIGSRFTDGRGVKVDLAEASKWYQLASDKGLAPAEYRLANFYEKGTGLTRDMAKAKALYLSAAEKGNASAMHNLAVLNATGVGGTPDFNEAARWFQQAAELNVRDSQFNLAILFARGNGVSQDLEESYKWFAIAAKQGDQDAAQKRDEVANALTPDKLKSAKAKLDLWKPAAIDDNANNAVVPDEWVAKSNTTASIDMKRAIRNIQAILNNNGFDAGKPDGEMGKKTVQAIKAFQKSVGQEPTGRINDALVKELLARNKKS